MIAAAVNWSDAERAAWAPPPRLSCSEWAERYRILPARGTAEPGPLRLDRTPYLREILDKLGDNATTEVVFVKSAQVGGTEAGKTAVGYWIDTSADNVLACLPDQASAREYMTQRIQPLLAEPRLERWTTEREYDLRKGQVDLLHCSVFLGWSGSPQSMASRSIRFALSDEVDKAQASAKEAGALDLIRDRLITFGHRAKHFILSTPTTKDGPIWREWTHTSDKRRYHVPCPHCGVEQVLVWAQVRWEDRDDKADVDDLVRLADRVHSGQARAWYLCPECGSEIDDAERLEAVQAGRWVSELAGEDPRSRRIAYHISALYSAWVSLGDLVAEYLRGLAKDDLRNFWNSFLGEPHEETAAKTAPGIMQRRAVAPPYVVPEWATCVVAGADTQARNGSPYWYWTVRAYGKGYQGRTLAFGKAFSEADLIASTLDQRFAVEGGGGWARALILCVDSGGGVELVDGNTTEVVYRMAARDPRRVVAMKGHAGRQRPDKKVRTSDVVYTPPGSGKPPVGTKLHTIDTEHFKDVAARLIQAEEPVMWEESTEITEEYVGHMTREEKARVKVGERYELKWINPTRGRVDWWDASIYSLAGAHMVQVDRRRRVSAPKRSAEPKPAPADTTGRQRPAISKPPRQRQRRGGWISPGRR